MVDYLAGPVAHEALFKKYASKRFLKGNSSVLFLSSATKYPLANMAPASIFTRQWAKKYCAVDPDPPLGNTR